MPEEWEEALFTEPACEHNNHHQKGCAGPRPGELTKGCAFHGSHLFLLPVPGALHLIHGTPGCLFNSAGYLGAVNGYEPEDFPVFSTHLSREEIMAGSEANLAASIDGLVDTYRPTCVFVYATCITLLTMDKVDAVCEAAERKHALPVLVVHSQGFAGNRQMGTRQAGEILFRRIICAETAVPQRLTSFDINLIGEYEFCGSGEEIEDILGKIGIRVLSKIAGGRSFQDLPAAASARVNVLAGGRALLALSRNMRDAYGTPFIEASFYGSKEIRFSLRQLAFHFQNDWLDRKIHRYIRKEEESLRKDTLADCKELKGRRVVLFTDGADSWLFLSALQELGLKVAAIGTNRNAQEDYSRIRERAGDAILVKDCSEKKILGLYRERKAELMIVGGRNAYVPLKEMIPFLNLDEERCGYIGYRGVRRLARDLVEVIKQPVWEVVRRPAPWEGGTYADGG
ncbi:nitrogenase component 1 [Gorillibacterium massiliense]|uniref:nitrogenase component 1 n=1 Tax=Gorillibacterium massiliense TaxID=1280390 RepID=UPI0004AEB7F9|nr:nitrogenase component 1 [Gorillibacterium massiliense]